MNKTPAIALIMIAAFCARGVAQHNSADEVLPTLILFGAQEEALRGTPYIEKYESIAYPGGDVDPDTGVCTDLVIRAFRNAGIDLQEEVHKDRTANPDAYPTELWSYKKADKNIDHRRCQNLVVWFSRHTESLTTDLPPDAEPDSWRAGDVVFFVRSGQKHPWHVAIISGRTNNAGMPLVIHSFPPRTRATDTLDLFGPIHSHFRIDPDSALASRALKRIDELNLVEKKASTPASGE